MGVTTLHPTAGYILDVARGAEPGPLSLSERERLRSLARRVAEIAADPRQKVKRDLWYRHNRLEPVRPMLLVFPEDSWAEVLPESQLELSDPFWRQHEWYLKHIIYRDRMLPDDFVVEPELWVQRIVRWGGWGLEAQFIHPEQAKGSYVWDAPIKDPADIARLRFPTVEVDEPATQRTFQATSEVFADLLPVRISCALPHANLIGDATRLRGIEQVMVDMHDRPAWLHELMGFLAEGFMAGVKYLEANNYLTLNNGHHYTDSGGLGYSTELLAPGFDGVHVRLRDLWGFGVAQELSEVGPRQHEEFVLSYQLRLLEQCGLNAYGCCEPYTHKFEMLARRVPRLRRVSVSPWCNLEKAAARLENRYIFSWKPNPAMLVQNFDPEACRAYIRRALHVARGCVLEMIHKDTFTLEHKPARLEAWCRIAREEIERESP
jgi:hypothetical protein